MWKSESVFVLLILLFGSGNFLTMERGFVAHRTNDSVPCQMPEACDVPGFTNWFRVGHHCVQYFNKPLNFTDAELNCRTKAPGAHLVSVHERKHNDFLTCIVRKLNPNNVRIWLGGFEFLMSGKFFWLDGSFWNFQAWVPGEPNHKHKNTEECVEMNWKEYGKWNDDGCSIKKNYMCAFKRKGILEVGTE